MKKLGLFVFVVLVLAFAVHTVEKDWKAEHKDTPRIPLDYSRPVYTTDHAIICPLGTLLDVRSGHGRDALLDLFTSVFNLKTKEANLGCEEWMGGLQVDAVPIRTVTDLRYVQINGSKLTIEVT